MSKKAAFGAGHKRQDLRVYRIKGIKDFVGFALENSVGGNMTRVRFQAALTSDDPEFYVYADQIASSFLNPIEISIDGVHHLLIIIHSDLNADIYINNIPIVIDMRPKKEILKGGKIMKGDIADIGKMSFPDIEILDSDKIIFCFKVGWRFGLYFDVGPREWSKLKPAPRQNLKALDKDLMEHELGRLYRHLSFYDLFKSIRVGPSYARAISDGWFPFIEIIGSEYTKLAGAYRENFDIAGQEDKLVSSFDKARLDRLSDKWWKNPFFGSKRTIIEAALQAYAQDDHAGFINCIKNLSTEIEGLLRAVYLADTGSGKAMNSKALIDHIIMKMATPLDSGSLFLPEYFLEYLRDVIFANFDGDDPDPLLSRNSSGHGLVKPEKYTKARALQMVLALDQIYFYAS